VIVAAGFQSQGACQMGLAQADPADEHHVLSLAQERHGEQMQDLLAVDDAGPMPVEGVERAVCRQPGESDTPLYAACPGGLHLAVEQPQENVVVRAVPAGGFGEFALVVFEHPGELELSHAGDQRVGHGMLLPQ
jgi:hypothetical protein